MQFKDHVHHNYSNLELTDLYPLLQLLEVWLGSLDLSRHQQVGHLHYQVEGANKWLLVSMVLLHQPAGLVQYLTSLLVVVMSQQNLSAIIIIGRST